MLRIRHGWLAVVLAVGAVSACKKDDKSDPVAGALGGSAVPGTSASPASGDDLALLPVDSEIVIGINVAQLQDSALWKQFVGPALDKARTQGKVDKLKEIQDKCGFDPVTSIKSVSIGVKNTSNDKPDGVFVVHGVDKAKAASCVDKMKAEAAANGTEITKDGDVYLVKNKDKGDTTGIVFVNDTTAVMVVGDKGATAASVKAVAAGGGALKTSPTFVEMYSKVKTTDSVWFVVNGKLLEKAAAIGTKPKAVFGSLNVSDGLALDTRIKVDSPDVAAQLAGKIKEQTAQAAAMVDKIDVASDADVVKLNVVLSNQKLQALITQFGALFGLGGLGSH
jgi:hypothetical protein